jgi:hypothetical protein
VLNNISLPFIHFGLNQITTDIRDGNIDNPFFIVAFTIISISLFGLGTLIIYRKKEVR